LDIVLFLHSLVRYVLLLVMTAGLIRAVVALAKQAEPAQIDQTLENVFIWSFYSQALLGLLIIFLGGLSRPLHTLLMLIALVFALWMRSIAKQSQGAMAQQARIALYAVPLATVMFSLALIGQLLR
jgi:Na+/H+ antiporter NhaD/arsenite permease-like protein